MKKSFFIFLAKTNKLILPSMIRKDLYKLNKFQKLIVGYRCWVTKNSL
ncbi:MAG: SsrA-binding protein [Crocinitomicaceae bacterium]|nr:SsrA-binding protein [Crocinitomicaceae bacterium]